MDVLCQKVEAIHPGRILLCLLLRGRTGHEHVGTMLGSRYWSGISGSLDVFLFGAKRPRFELHASLDRREEKATPSWRSIIVFVYTQSAGSCYDGLSFPTRLSSRSATLLCSLLKLRSCSLNFSENVVTCVLLLSF